MAYIKNRMCNLQLWGSNKEEVVYLKKKTNNHIYALMGISSGLKGICIQTRGFSVWSRFQMNMPLNCPEFIQSMQVVSMCLQHLCRSVGVCIPPKLVCSYLLSCACAVVKQRLAGHISVSLKATFYFLAMKCYILLHQCHRVLFFQACQKGQRVGRNVDQRTSGFFQGRVSQGMY